MLCILVGLFQTGNNWNPTFCIVAWKRTRDNRSAKWEWTNMERTFSCHYRGSSSRSSARNILFRWASLASRFNLTDLTMTDLLCFSFCDKALPADVVQNWVCFLLWSKLFSEFRQRAACIEALVIGPETWNQLLKEAPSLDCFTWWL